jgi:DNA-binding SARP family transcriptional activator/TolB-like protein/Tfp pilus assembly protein PilF
MNNQLPGQSSEPSQFILFDQKQETGHAEEIGRPIVRIHVIGSMRATTLSGTDVLPKGKKARAVLGYLSLAGGEWVPRARLAAMLWDRVPDTYARTSLRQALRELSSAMGPLALELILTDRDTIKLNISLCWVDAIAVLAREAQVPQSSRSDLAAFCSGELLEELDGMSTSFDQWLVCERTRFTEQINALLEAHLYQLTQSKADAKSRASVARRLIAFDPTHEGASRALMHALADMGERAQALREYARCRNALRKVLDVEPSHETRALYQAIKSFAGRDVRDEGGYPSTLSSGSTSPPTKRSRLRVGVLPFLPMCSKEAENLAFSLSQEIAAGLARFRWFDVIAPASLIHYQSDGDLSENLPKWRELDYVVEGALSANSRTFQISVRLLDLAQFGRPVWSDRFELAAGELHQLNDRVTARIVGRIDQVILFIEGQPKRRRDYGALGLLLLARPLMYSMERTKYEEAGDLINRALETDPNDAMASAWAAHWHVHYVGQGWSADPVQAFSIAQRHGLNAIRLDPENAEALGIYAHICSFLGKDFESAMYYFDRALRANPNLGFIWLLSALTHCYIGEPDIAFEQLERHRDLSPIEPYPSLFDNPYAIAHLIKGEYEQAVVFARRVAKARPEFVNGYKPLIAALGLLRRRGDAKPYVEKLRSLEPHFTVQRFSQVYPLKYESDRERYMQGLRLAGIPED